MPVFEDLVVVVFVTRVGNVLVMPLGVGPTVAAVGAFILGLGMWYGDWLHWLVCNTLTCHIFSEK